MIDDARRNRTYGAEQAKRIRLRLNDLDAAETLEVMRTVGGQCHELTGDRTGQLAVHLNGNYRLIFEPADDPPAVKKDGGIAWPSVRAIRILEVVDYH